MGRLASLPLSTNFGTKVLCHRGSDVKSSRRKWSRGQPPEIGLGLVSLASASRFWPRLTSLHKGSLTRLKIWSLLVCLTSAIGAAAIFLFCMYSTIVCVTNLLNFFGPTLTPILYCLSLNAQLYKIPQFHFLTSCKP